MHLLLNVAMLSAKVVSSSIPFHNFAVEGKKDRLWAAVLERGTTTRLRVDDSVDLVVVRTEPSANLGRMWVESSFGAEPSTIR